MSKHTPGPWAIEYTGCSDDTDFDIETATIRAGHIVVAKVECHHESIANIEANAKLIAAATDMAEALRNIEMWIAAQPENVRCLPPIECALHAARAALAKAGL